LNSVADHLIAAGTAPPSPRFLEFGGGSLDRCGAGSAVSSLS
jgi:hypothetical protein